MRQAQSCSDTDKVITHYLCMYMKVILHISTNTHRCQYESGGDDGLDGSSHDHSTGLLKR